MRVPVRWVVSLGLTLVATGCVPSASRSLSLAPPASAGMMTVADETPAREPAQQKATNKKWLLIGAGAVALIVVIILLSGGDGYDPPGEGLGTIR